MALYAHDFRAEADASFAQAQRFDPRDPRWPYLRGASMAQDDPGAALPLLRQASDLSGESAPPPHLTLAEILLERGERAVRSVP